MCPYLQLNLVFIGLYSRIRGTHGHESQDKVVCLGCPREFVDLREVNILGDDVDVLLLHELFDFLFLLVFIGCLFLVFFILRFIILTNYLFILDCLDRGGIFLLLLLFYWLISDFLCNLLFFL